MKNLFFLVVLWIVSINTYADDIQFTTNAPDAVVNGEQFKISFTVNSTNVRDFRAPSITDFEVLMGPSRSQQSSTQIINGNVSSSSSITYTYVLIANKVGTFTIPGSTIKINGKDTPVIEISVKSKDGNESKLYLDNNGNQVKPD